MRYLTVTKGAFTSFDLDRHGQRLLTGHSNGVVRIWDIVRGVEASSYIAFTGLQNREIERLCLSPSGTHFVAGRLSAHDVLLMRCEESNVGPIIRPGWLGNEGQVFTYAMVDGRLLQFNHRGTYLYVGIQNRYLTNESAIPIHWIIRPLEGMSLTCINMADINGASAKKLINVREHEFKTRLFCEPESIHFTNSQLTLSHAEFYWPLHLLLTWENNIASLLRFNDQFWEPLQQFHVDSAVRTAKISPDGSCLYILTGRSLHCWDLSDFKKQWHTVFSDYMQFALAIHPNLPLAAIGGNNREVILANLLHGQEVDRLYFNIGKIRKLQFTPDGTTGIAMGNTRRMAMWDVE